MKISSLPSRLRVSFIAGLAVLLAACRPSADPGGGTSAAEPPVTEITITGNDQMRFAPTQFTVARGSRVTLVLHNSGTMPKEAMGHNLVILKPGTNANGFAASSMRYPTDAYVAPELRDSVVGFTPVLGPGERYTLEFTVPEVAGDYPFVCSFPGHTPAGMVGIMRVQ